MTNQLNKPVVDGVHPETYCHRCGGPNLSWSASSPLWNAVMRDNDINGEWNEIICPTCFVVLAKETGVTNEIFITTKKPKIELTTVTPSGRVWSEEKGLWVEPAAILKKEDSKAGEA